MSKIEISYDHLNRDLYFRPLDRNIRGRFMLSRVAEPTAMSYRDRIPEDIPGQVLGIDTAKGVGYLLEPIHDNPRIKAKIENRGMSLEPERQEFPVADTKVWLYWFKAVVDAGKATVLTGELPDEVNYDPPPMLGPKPKRGPTRLREIFRDNPDVAAKYLTWNESDKRKWETLVGV